MIVNPFVIVLTLSILVFYLFVLPVLCLIFGLYRRCVLVLAKYLRPDLEHLITGSGVLFAIDQLFSKPTYNVGTTILMEGEVPLARIRGDFQRCLDLRNPEVTNEKQPLYPEFGLTLKPFLGYSFWAKCSGDPFSINDQIRDYEYHGGIELPSRDCSQEDVRRVMNGLLSKPWKEGRPLWEILRVPGALGQDPEKRQTLIIIRFHHALGDGYSLHRIIFRDVARLEDHGIPEPQFKIPNKCVSILGVISVPFSFSYVTAVNIHRMWKDGYNAWHQPKSKMAGNEYFVASSPYIEVERIKAVRRRHKVPYNAVLCTALAGAIKRSMKEAGQSVPKVLSCTIPVPLPEHPEGACNYMAYVITEFPLNTSDRGRALQKISKTLKEAKNIPYLMGNAVLFRLWELAPNFVARIAAFFSTTMILSCSPGPAKAIDIFGSKCTNVAAFAGLGFSGFGGFACFLSYGGFQHITVTIDQNLFPNEGLFAKLGEYIVQELEELCEALPNENVDDSSMFNV